jgi:serine/threonine protein kinase
VIDTGQALRAVAAAGRDVEDLHRVGRAHGAISPKTLIISSGSSKLLPPPGDRPPGLVTNAGDWTELGAVAPEMLHGELPNAASDVWSLGATLHVLLTGAAVYPHLEGEHPVTAVQRIMFTRPSLDSRLPPTVAPIIARCVERDPGDRWAGAGELSDHLTEAASIL